MNFKQRETHRRALRDNREARLAIGGNRRALYCRTSSEDQEQKGTIENQVSELTRIAVGQGWQIVGQYLDDGVSGTVPLDERPYGAKLIEDAKAGLFDTVVLWKVDRLGRSTRVLLDAHDLLEEAGVALQSATEPFETGTAVGKFVFNLLASLAELDRANILEKTQVGRERYSEKPLEAGGKWMGGPLPFGLDIDPQTGALCPLPGEAEHVLAVFEAIAGGSTAIAQASRLQGLGVPAHQRYVGGRVIERSVRGWYPSRVSEMIHNPVYKGTSVRKTRRKIISRPVFGLIPVDLWERANAQLTANRTLSKKNARHDYLLSGLIVCGNCGLSYVGTARDRRGVARRSYRCNGQCANNQLDASQRCRAASVDADKLEAAVWALVVWMVEHPNEAVDDAWRIWQTEEAKDQRDLAQDRPAHLARLTKLNEVHANFTRALGWDSKADPDVIRAELEAIDTERAAIRRELDRLETHQAVSRAKRSLLAGTAEFLASLKADLASVAEDFEAKKATVRDLVRRVTITTDLEAPLVTLPSGGRQRPFAATLTPRFDRTETPLFGSAVETDIRHPVPFYCVTFPLVLA